MLEYEPPFASCIAELSSLIPTRVESISNELVRTTFVVDQGSKVLQAEVNRLLQDLHADIAEIQAKD